MRSRVISEGRVIDRAFFKLSFEFHKPSTAILQI